MSNSQQLIHNLQQQTKRYHLFYVDFLTNLRNFKKIKKTLLSRSTINSKNKLFKNLKLFKIP